MNEIKTQVRQAAENAYLNYGGGWKEAADASALKALEVVQKHLRTAVYGSALDVLDEAIAAFKPQPHPLLARLTALEQQQKELTKQIAAVRQEMEQ